MAKEGAKVGMIFGDVNGGSHRAPAQQTVDEIKSKGGQAVANVENIATIKERH
jgi:hypothetical protein